MLSTKILLTIGLVTLAVGNCQAGSARDQDTTIGDITSITTTVSVSAKQSTSGAAQKTLKQRAISAHMTAVRGKIQANWLIPSSAAQIHCKADVHTLQNGQVTSVKLLDSCGSNSANRSVLAAVKDAAPLPMPPPVGQPSWYRHHFIVTFAHVEQ